MLTNSIIKNIDMFDERNFKHIYEDYSSAYNYFTKPNIIEQLFYHGILEYPDVQLPYDVKC